LLHKGPGDYSGPLSIVCAFPANQRFFASGR
jgi:hypothetical protein